jgi:hypothetical protein
MGSSTNQVIQQLTKLGVGDFDNDDLFYSLDQVFLNIISDEDAEG